MTLYTSLNPLDANSFPACALLTPALHSMYVDFGSFHTSEYRGGVERRQMELKGVEGGD